MRKASGYRLGASRHCLSGGGLASPEALGTSPPWRAPAATGGSPPSSPRTAPRSADLRPARRPYASCDTLLASSPCQCDEQAS
jgi:hypothetical protein